MRRGLGYLRVSTKRQASKGFAEDGLSLTDQKQRILAHAQAHDILIVDWYIEKGESARTRDRREFQAMLARIRHERDVDVVVVYKVNRFARNLYDHVTIRTQLRKLGVELESVVERLEDTPEGKLTEGLHALLAEFYSDNLSADIRRGMLQKAKQGGWSTRAPLGYRNVRITIGGRQVAHIEPDPERAPHITAAFELYASGNYTIEELTAELEARGLRNRGRGDYPPGPVSYGGVAKLLANKVYAGLIEWNGVVVPGRHQPLVDPLTFARVQDLLAARATRGTRERKHPHYLKGLLHCGVCTRRWSFQLAHGNGGAYAYFYCIGRMRGSGCQEPYIPIGRLERQVEKLYTRIQLPTEWAQQLDADLAKAIAERHGQEAEQRAALLRTRTRLAGERRKLLEAYDAEAISLGLLRDEQQRLDHETRIIDDRLAALEATLEQWRPVLATAHRLAADCGTTYARADAVTRKVLNRAVLQRIELRDGRIARVEYQPPFDLLFGGCRFQYRTKVELSSSYLNHHTPADLRKRMQDPESVMAQIRQ